MLLFLLIYLIINEFVSMPKLFINFVCCILITNYVSLQIIQGYKTQKKVGITDFYKQP
jgi:hypothetical protein